MADVVVAGALAQRPGRAGHAWVFLNWMLGFRRAGHDVIFVDRWPRGLGGCDVGVAWVREVMSHAGFADAWAVVLPSGSSVGLPRARLDAKVSGSILLNVMGYLTDDHLLALPDRRVCLDIDPGFGQSWQASGLAEIFIGHDAYATVGLNVGRAGCLVPSLGLDWVSTLPPVDIAHWECSTPPAGGLTTIASWRGPFGPIVVDGVTYGLRVHAARRLADVPAGVDTTMEVALDIDESDAADRQLLVDGGWVVRSPHDVAGDLETYRSYIHGSLGEFAIAKEVYTALVTGWFSDRSACYLASGRPVIVSDTGLDSHIPTECGVLTYSTSEEAVAAIDEVRRSSNALGAAAREFAHERFASALVAQLLLERVG